MLHLAHGLELSLFGEEAIRITGIDLRADGSDPLADLCVVRIAARMLVELLPN